MYYSIFYFYFIYLLRLDLSWTVEADVFAFAKLGL